MSFAKETVCEEAAPVNARHIPTLRATSRNIIAILILLLNRLDLAALRSGGASRVTIDLYDTSSDSHHRSGQFGGGGRLVQDKKSPEVPAEAGGRIRCRVRLGKPGTGSDRD